MDGEDSELASLRAEISRLLAAALAAEERHLEEIERRDQQHVAEAERRDELHAHEMERRDDLHIRELERRDDLHAHEQAVIRDALETRDLIGQAKGVIMATMGGSPDEAFNLLRQQSQHENRKLVDVAAEIANRAASHRRRLQTRPGAP